MGMLVKDKKGNEYTRDMARHSSGNLQVYSPHGIEMYTNGTVIIKYTKT